MRFLLFFASAGVLAIACGGSSFTAGGPVDSGATDGGGTGEASADAAPDRAAAAEGGGPLGQLHCGPMTVCTGTTPICCVSDSSQFGCAHEECGCETQLACRRKDDCAGSDVCCIQKETDATCQGGHDVAACLPLDNCLPPAHVLCDPMVPGSCGGVLKCNSDATSLSAVGLPAGYGFGVCGT